MPLTRRLAFGAIMAALTLTLTGDSEAGKPKPRPRPQPQPSILDRVVALNRTSGEFSTLIAALQATNLTGPLAGNDQLTVFAPTDDAFAAIGLDQNNIGSLDPDVLANILLYHVTGGRRLSHSLAPSAELTMLNGDLASTKLRRLFGRPSGLYINQSLIVFPNVTARNGVIHVIDRVLMPPSP